MRKLLFTTACLLYTAIVSAQLVKIPLSRKINNALEHERGAAISGDGRTMIFMREDYRKSAWYFFITRKSGRDWTVPEEFLTLNKSTKLNYVGGYCLNFDGTEFFYSTVKFGGVGNWDIWSAKLTGGANMTTPGSLGRPLNSEKSELCPSISADGDYMYFIRQDSRIGPTDVASGTIMMSYRKGNSWSDPEPLPSNITTGQETCPRILADGVTLVYASKKVGGKGGHDLYMTRKSEGKWTDPVPYEFLNTPDDDMFISIDVGGISALYGFKDDAEDAKEDIYMVKIPEELRPYPVLLFVGQVLEQGTKKPLEAIIQATDLDTKELVYTARPDEEGKFYLPLGGNRKYDFSIQILDKKHAFFSETIDIKDLDKYTIKKELVEIIPLTRGKSFVLNASDFPRGSMEVDEDTDRDIRRLLKMMKDNPSLKIEVGVHTDEVLTDTIRSNADLTELIVDTTYIEVPDTAKIAITDSLGNVEMVPDTVKPEPIMVLKYTYHNDRTSKQAKSFKEILELKGVPSQNIVTKGYGAKKNISSNSTPEGREENRRIEIKVL